MPALRNSLNIRSRVMWVRAFFNTYKRRVIAAGGVIQNEPCAVRSLNNNLLRSASWTLVPSGIEEDIVFAQKPISGLGDLTYTRASDATYTDSTGVVRRSPYNLLQFSEMYTDAYWTKTATVTANTDVAPNGTLTADTLTDSNSAAFHDVRTSLITVVANRTHTTSCFIKKTTGALTHYAGIAVLLTGGSTRVDYGIVNTTNGTVVRDASSNVNSASYSIQDFGDYWRVICTFTDHQSNTSYRVILYPAISVNGTSISDTATGSNVFWGAQLVEGTEPLDYFPTTNRQDVPRIDFRNADGTLSSCGRLLLEPQRTNSIRNSSMVGAVTGSPGTLPTNWTLGTSGLTQTIVAVGTEDGLPYIDLRVNGTATSTSVLIGFEGQVVATAAQAWTNSAYIKIVNAPSPPAIYRLLYVVRGSATTFPNQPITPTTTLSRFAYTITTPAGTTSVQPYFECVITNGAAYDFTIRIAAPQMELGGYATTWVPTTTAAVTRLLDSFTRSNIFTNGLISSAGGTWFVEISDNLSIPRDSASGIFIGDSSTPNTGNQIIIRNASSPGAARLSIIRYIAGTSTVLFNTTTSKIKIAIKWNGSILDVFVNGVKQSASNIFTTTTMQNMIASAGQTFEIDQMLLAPTPLSDAQCIQLTTL